MDIRIGVIQTAKELLRRAAGRRRPGRAQGTDRRRPGRHRAGAVGDRPGGPRGGACRPSDMAYVELGGRRRPSGGWGSAADSDRPASIGPDHDAPPTDARPSDPRGDHARPARPEAAGGHRQGRRGQDHGGRRPGPARRRAGASARWPARSTPRATWPPPSTCPRSGFEPVPGPPACGHGHGHRGLAAGVPQAQPAPAPGARLGPLARTFDFVADAAPGVKEILTGRQAGLGGPGSPLRPRGRRRPGLRPRGRPSGAPRPPSPSWSRWASSAPRPTGCWRSSGDPARTGAVVVTTPEEMPVTETVELVGQSAARDGGGRGRHRRQPGAARAVQPPGGGAVRAAGGPSGAGRRWRRRWARRRRRARRRPPGRRPAPPRGRPPGPAPRASCPTCRSLYVPERFGRSRGACGHPPVAQALGEELA